MVFYNRRRRRTRSDLSTVSHCGTLLESRTLLAQYVPLMEFDGFATPVLNSPTKTVLLIVEGQQMNLQRIDSVTGEFGPKQEIPNSTAFNFGPGRDMLAMIDTSVQGSIKLLLARDDPSANKLIFGAEYLLSVNDTGTHLSGYVTETGTYLSFRRSDSTISVGFFPFEAGSVPRWMTELPSGDFWRPLNSPIFIGTDGTVWKLTDDGSAPLQLNVDLEGGSPVGLLSDSFLFNLRQPESGSRLISFNLIDQTFQELAIFPIDTVFEIASDSGGPADNAVVTAVSNIQTTLILTTGRVPGTQILPALSHPPSSNPAPNSPVYLVTENLALISVDGRRLASQNLTTGAIIEISDVNRFGVDTEQYHITSHVKMADEIWLFAFDSAGMMAAYRTDGYELQQIGMGWPQTFGFQLLRLGETVGVLSGSWGQLLSPTAASDSILFKLDTSLPDSLSGPVIDEINTNVPRNEGLLLNWQPVSGAIEYQVKVSPWDDNAVIGYTTTTIQLSTTTSLTQLAISIPAQGAYGWHKYSVRAIFADGTASQWSTQTAALSFAPSNSLDTKLYRFNETWRLAAVESAVLPTRLQIIRQDSLNGSIVFDQPVNIQFEPSSNGSPFAGDNISFYFYVELPVLADGVYRIIAERRYVDVLPDHTDMSLPPIQQTILATVRNEQLVINPDSLTVVSQPEGVRFNWNGSLLNGESGFTVWVDDRTRGIPRVIHQTVNDHSLLAQLRNGRYRAWVGRRDPASGQTFWSPPTDFLVNNPLTVTAPIRNNTIARPTFQWTGGIDGTYEVWLNNLTTGQRVRRETVQGAQAWQVPVDLAPGRYAFWVRELFNTGPGPWSSVYVVNQLQAPVEVIHGLAPGVDQTPELGWVAQSDAATYELWISRKGQTNARYRVTGLTSTQHHVASPLGNGEFTVWVRSYSSAGIGSQWGPGYSMSIGSPITPQLTVDVLSWPAVASATHYELWIDYLGGAQLPRNAFIHRTDLTTNQWSLPASMPRGTYRVWVRALRSEANQVYGGLWGTPLMMSISLSTGTVGDQLTPLNSPEEAIRPARRGSRLEADELTEYSEDLVSTTHHDVASMPEPPDALLELPRQEELPEALFHEVIAEFESWHWPPA